MTTEEKIKETIESLTDDYSAGYCAERIMEIFTSEIRAEKIKAYEDLLLAHTMDCYVQKEHVDNLISQLREEGSGILPSCSY